MDEHTSISGRSQGSKICLILGEARLWYESLRPINVDWQGLQNQFRQQYSKIGNTREQLFHAWRSFHFDENTVTLDAYVTHIRQVATLLGYGELQIQEGFINTLPTKLYWVLFPINDLRQAVETAKRIVTKEKINRQLAGQSSSTPFMSIKGSYNQRVTFDTLDGVEDKIDKLTVMMVKLSTRKNGTNRQFKGLRFIKAKEGDRVEIVMIHIIMIEEIIKIGIDEIAEIEKFNLVDKVGVDQGINRIIWMSIGKKDFRGNMRTYQNFKRQNRGKYRRNYRNENYNRERDRSRSRERSFSRNISNRRNDRSINNSRWRSGSRASTNRDRIRCYKCREYDHFMKDCPTSKEER